MLRTTQGLLWLAAATLATTFAAPPVHAAPAAGGDADEDVVLTPELGREYEVGPLVRDVAARRGMVAVVDEGVRDRKVRFETATPLDLDTVASVLEVHDVQLLVEHVGTRRILKAVRQREAYQERFPLVDVVADPSKVSRLRVVSGLFRPEHLSSGALQQAQTAIRAVMTRDPLRLGSIVCVPGLDLIVVTDQARNVEAYLTLLREMDRPSAPAPTGDDPSVRAIAVTHASAESIARRIGQLYAKDAPLVRATADYDTSRVVLRGPAAELERLEALIATLDVEPAVERRAVHVVACQHADARELSSVLRSLVRADIQADPRTNSLVVSATPDAFAELLEVIRALDREVPAEKR